MPPRRRSERLRQGKAAGAGPGDGSGAGPGPSSLALAATRRRAKPAGLLDALGPLLSRGQLDIGVRRALRLACRGAGPYVDAALRSLDLREAATGGPVPDALLPGLGAFVARSVGLQELRADAATPSLTRAVGLVVAAGRGRAAGVRSVRLSTAVDGTIGPAQSEVLRSAFPGLQVRRDLSDGCGPRALQRCSTIGAAGAVSRPGRRIGMGARTCGGSVCLGAWGGAALRCAKFCFFKPSSRPPTVLHTWGKAVLVGWNGSWACKLCGRLRECRRTAGHTYSGGFGCRRGVNRGWRGNAARRSLRLRAPETTRPWFWRRGRSHRSRAARALPRCGSCPRWWVGQSYRAARAVRVDRCKLGRWWPHSLPSFLVPTAATPPGCRR